MARIKPQPAPETETGNVVQFPPTRSADAASGGLPAYNPLTSSARLLEPTRANNPQYAEWQNQAWNFYDSLEHLAYGVSWLSKMISRVRLVAAETIPGQDEPRLVSEGPAADAVSRLAGGVGGQARLLSEFATHFSVPGECWLVGESPDPTTNLPGAPTEETWTIYSADELRVSQRRYPGVPKGTAGVYEVRTGQDITKANNWRLLSLQSMVIKCWNSHPRFGFLADSPTRHALGACIELDLVNKRIMAMILSRLANNGVLLYDKSRMSLPTRTNPNDPQNASNSPGDLAQVFVDVAKQGIADPMSPAACIPIPIGFEIPDLSDVDPKLLMQHIRFSEGVDDKLLQLRDSAIRRLATAIDLPAAILLGMEDANHWGAAAAEESAIKVHVTPVAELITYSLTVGYLYPMLKAAGLPQTGPNGGRLIIWYDPSEIVVRPDKSQNAIAAWDRQVITDATMRREIGVSEGDAPTPEEQVNQLLRKQASQGSLEALQVLNGDIKLGDLTPTAEPGVRADTEAVPPQEKDDSTATGRPPGAPDRPPGPQKGGRASGTTPPGGDTPASQPSSGRSTPGTTRPSAN